MNLYRITAMLIIFCLILGILIVGKNFLIPIFIAIGVWFFFNAVANVFTKVKIKGKIAPLWLRYLFASLCIMLFTYGTVKIINTNIHELQSQMEFYTVNLENFEKYIYEKFGLKKSDIPIPEIQDKFNVKYLFSTLFDSLAGLVENTFLIILYLIFMLLEQHMFGEKIKMIFSGKISPTITKNFDKIKKSIESYILLKTSISLFEAILSYIIMSIIGVDFAMFWAFLIFILNFIPNIGSIIATAFPALLCLIQFDTITPALVVFFVLGFIQFTIGNFLEPKIFGKSMNISALVVILSLTFWGTIWGIIGMFLSVPITVILLIILGSFNETKPFAILLSDDGKI